MLLRLQRLREGEQSRLVKLKQPVFQLNKNTVFFLPPLVDTIIHLFG